MGTDNCSDGKHVCTKTCDGPVQQSCNTCHNVGGNGYKCVCPANYAGDGRADGDGCKLIVNDRDPLLPTNTTPSTKATPSYGGSSSHPPGTSTDTSADTKKFPIAAAVSGGVGLIVIVGLLVLFWYWLKRRRKDSKKSFSISLGYELPDFKKFRYSELIHATNNFDQSRILGKGGQGTVYQGSIKGCKVAIKKCGIEGTEVEENDDNYKEFVNETRLLGEIRHDNIVRVLGYCIESGLGYIVYELIKNGTLQDLLHEDVNKPLPWRIRLEIAVGIAGALKHLHNDTPKVIIHRDIKSTNILLDDNCKAKLADFGISRMMGEGDTHVLTGVKGTPGYFAPENYESEEQRVEGDVFSFGVVLGEIVTRKMNNFKDDGTGQVRLLHEYLRSLQTETMMEAAVDKELFDDPSNRDNILVALDLAKRCCAIDRTIRPKMTQVFEVLSHMRLSRDCLTAKRSFASTSVLPVQ